MDTTTEKRVMKLTPGRRRALEGVKECAGVDGWATCWPGDILPAKLKECVQVGWLEQSVKTVPGCGPLTWTAYRLTESGGALLAVGAIIPDHVGGER